MKYWVAIIFSLVSLSGLAQSVRFEERKSDDSLHLDLINEFFGPVYIKFQKLPAGEFLRIPEEAVIPASSIHENIISIPLRYFPDTSASNYDTLFTSNASLGDPYHSKHEKNHFYTLPFSKDKSYPVLQSWSGRFSHYSKESKYAIDFKMPVGDTICAARTGIVVRVEDSFTQNGGPQLKSKANQIVVLHNDGTLAFYVHLKHKGVLVEPGDIVQQGELIGLSGNTGYSTVPHLHFVVREAPDKAVKIFFEGYEKKILKKNKSYKRHK